MQRAHTNTHARARTHTHTHTHTHNLEPVFHKGSRPIVGVSGREALCRRIVRGIVRVCTLASVVVAGLCQKSSKVSTLVHLVCGGIVERTFVCM